MNERRDISCAENGPWYMFSEGVWNELVSSDCFSGEVRKVAELLKTEPTSPLGSPQKPVQTRRCSTQSLCLLGGLKFWPPPQLSQCPAFISASASLPSLDLINRIELSGLKGAALLIQKLATVTPAQKHFLGIK